MQWIAAKHTSWMLTIADHHTCNSKQLVPVLHPAVAEKHWKCCTKLEGDSLEGHNIQY